MHARWMLVIAPLLLTGCPRTKEYKFDNGYRLVIEKDEAGNVKSAKAFSPDRREVPVKVFKSLRDVSVCESPAGTSAKCEPLVYMPDGTMFRTGDHSACWVISWGVPIKLDPCPTG